LTDDNPSPPARFYTRTGDDGYTGLRGKGRVPKYDLRPEACGQVDELQAVLGVCRTGRISRRGQKLLATVERHLYTLMAQLATGPDTALPEKTITGEDVAWLEQATDELGQALPPLKAFVLPGDCPAGAQMNLARTVARRAERAVARLLHQEGERSHPVLCYLNRLSSLLFVLARYEDVQSGRDRPTLVREA